MCGSAICARNESSTIHQLVNVCLDASHTLILPPEQIHELQSSVAGYARLSQRIAPEQIAALLLILQEVAEQPDSLQAELLSYGRDPKDDYLVAYGLIYHADYLITGDDDLLVLGTVEQLRIVRLAEMRRILAAQGLWSYPF